MTRCVSLVFSHARARSAGVIAISPDPCRGLQVHRRRRGGHRGAHPPPDALEGGQVGRLGGHGVGEQRVVRVLDATDSLVGK